MSRLGSAARFFLGVIAVATASADTRGQTAPLSAAVTAVEPCGKDSGAAIVTVKVTNRGAAAIEPLCFEFAPKTGSPVVLRRAPAPYVGRIGRPVRAGGSETYPLLHAGSTDRLVGATVRVIESCPAEGAALSTLPVVLGPPGTDKRKHELGATVEFATLTLTNKTDHTIDVTIRATFERPRAATVLVHRRLQPKEVLPASWSNLFVDQIPDIAPEGHELTIDMVVPPGARISGAKVVDWCAVRGATADATGLLESALARWLRWEKKAFGVSGAFAATASGGGNAAPRAITGKFTIGAGGEVTKTLDGDVAEADAQRIHRAIQVAFADLRRPPAAEAAASCRPRLDRLGPPTIVVCDGDAWDAAYRRTRFAVAGDRIVGHSWHGGGPNDLHVAWRCEPFEDGWIVAERQAFNISGRGTPTFVSQFRYARIDGVILPAAYRASEDLSPTAPRWDLDVTFLDLRVDAPDVPPHPSAATEAVRAAWNAGYRYPGAKIDATCTFDAKPGKDGVWRGAKQVKGRITFQRFDGHSRGRCVVEVAGVADESLRRSLAAAIDDRLGLWTGRDFAVRGDFDRVFSGASFSERPGAPGVFDVTGGPWRAVTIKDGRVVGLTFGTGLERSLTWTRVGEHEVVTRVVTGAEDVAAEYTAVGPLLLPTRFVFKGVFGDEKAWGTEEITLAGFAQR